MSDKNAGLKITCFACGSQIQEQQLISRGLSPTAVEILSKHICDGILDDVLRVAEIGMRNLTQDKLMLELQQKEYLDSTQDAILEMLNSMKKHQVKYYPQFENIVTYWNRQLVLYTELTAYELAEKIDSFETTNERERNREQMQEKKWYMQNNIADLTKCIDAT